MDSPRSASSAESRPKLPPSITELSKEDLQKTVQSLLRRIKLRDGQIKEFESRLASVAETPPTEDISTLQVEKEHLLQQKTRLEESLADVDTQLSSAQQHHQDISNQLQELTLALKTEKQEKKALNVKLANFADEQSALKEQVQSLKLAIESSVEDRDVAISRLSEEREKTEQLQDALAEVQTELRSQVENREETTGLLHQEEIQDEWNHKLLKAEQQFEQEKNALKKELAESEQKFAALEAENTRIKTRVKEELKSSLKQKNQMEEKIEELDRELTQHKTALMRASGQLEEAHQEQRITSQRLNDEQETTTGLKKELQDALTKLQTSELELWKRSESLTTEKTELDEKWKVRFQDKAEELKNLQSLLEAQKLEQSGHHDEIEKIKQGAESEKDKLKKVVGELRRRLDKITGQMKEVDLEKESLITTHNTEKEQKEEELASMEKRLEKFNLELKEYKAKAHLLVKNKDQEIQKLIGEVKELSDVRIELKALKEKFDDATTEKTNLNEELTQANERFQVHLDDIVGDFQVQLNAKTLVVLNLEKVCEEQKTASCQWSKKCSELERQLREKEEEVDSLIMKKSEVENRSCQECASLKNDLENLRGEFSAYRKTMEKMSEVHQEEMNRLIESNLDLRKAYHQHPQPQPSIERTDILSMDQDRHSIEEEPLMDSFHFEELLSTNKLVKSEGGDGSLSENQIVAIANKQAQREDTFQTLKKENALLASEIEELEKELHLHREQEQVLKNALRAADELKQANRESPPNMDYQYLRNTVMKLITTGEAEALLPVLAKLLSFTESEVEKLTDDINAAQQKRQDQLANSNTLLSSFSGWPWE